MKARFFSVLAVTAVLFASCNDNNDGATEVNDGQVKFSSGAITGHTRVGGVNGDQWEGNESIGIYMVDNAAASVAEGAGNVLYTTASVGAAAAFSSATPIYYPVDDAQRVDFIAYYPYRAAVSGYLYAVDAANQADQSAIDLMRALADNGGAGYDKTYGTPVNLVFDHLLTKLIFNASPGAGLTQSDLAGMTVTVMGLNTKADYHIDTDVLDAPTDARPVAARTVTAGERYEAVVVPQTTSGVTVEFALGSEVFVYTMPATVFSGGEKHTFDVTVQRTRVEVTGTISPWESVGVVTGTAN